MKMFCVVMNGFGGKFKPKIDRMAHHLLICHSGALKTKEFSGLPTAA